jgi:hypothetical protein
MPKTPPYEPSRAAGQRYCTELAEKAHTVSRSEHMAGIALIAIAGAGMVASGAITIYTGLQDEPSEALAYVGGGLSLLPVTLVPWGATLLSRADEAEALAIVSTAAITEPEDRDAYRRCALAKASWVGSRAGATALAREALEDDDAGEHTADETADDEPTAPTVETDGTAVEAPARKVDQQKMQLVLELLEKGRVDEARQLMESDVEIIED